MMEDNSKYKINHLRLCFFAALFMLFFVSAPVLAGTIVVNNEIQRQSEYVNLGKNKKLARGTAHRVGVVDIMSQIQPITTISIKNQVTTVRRHLSRKPKI
jgi:hypothetical protein